MKDLFLISLMAVVVHLPLSAQDLVSPWIATAIGNDHETSHKMATDKDGNIYVVGSFTSSNFSWQDKTAVLKGGKDLFIAKLNAQGKLQWLETAGGAGDESLEAITIDDEGFIYVAGTFSSNFFKWGDLEKAVSGEEDVFVAKLDPTNRKPVWLKKGEGNSKDFSKGITLDNQGNLYLIGKFRSSTFQIEGFSKILGLGVGGGQSDHDTFIVKLNASNGDVQWLVHGKGGGNDEINKISADNLGNIYVAGAFRSNTYTIEGTDPAKSIELSLEDPHGTISGYILKINTASGNPEWMVEGKGNGYEEVRGITSDKNGNLYVVGSFSSSNLTLVGPTHSLFRNNSNQEQPTVDCFIARINGDNGNPEWLIRGGSADQDEVTSNVSLDKEGKMAYIAGVFRSHKFKVEGLDTELTNSDPNSTSGKGTRDGFIAQINATDGNPMWLLQAEGDSDEHLNDIQLDNQNNIYIYGHFQSSRLKLAGQTRNNSNSGTSDLFISKITSGAATETMPFEKANHNLLAVSQATIDWVDFDNDDDLDLMLTGTIQSEGESDISIIYSNQLEGDERKLSITDKIDRTAPKIGLGVDWGDFNLDGYLDIILAGGNSSELHLNQSKAEIKFQRKPLNHSPSLEFSHGAAEWGDYDQDGDLDLLMAGLISGKSTSGSTQILENFETDSLEKTNHSLKGLSYGSASWGDYDRDGDLDFVVSGAEGNFINKNYKTIVYNNDKNQFIKADSLEPVWLSTTEWGDYNNDGYLDILLAGSTSSSTRDEKLKVYQYKPSTEEFEEVPLPGATGTFTFGSESAQWGDIDNNGWLDIIAIESDGLVVYLNEKGAFKRQIINIIVPYSDQNIIACADYDNDGDLDITVALKEKVGNNEIRRTWILDNKIGKKNARPGTPINLEHSISGNDITFTWNKPKDDLTPQEGLSYDIIVYRKDKNGKISSYLTPSMAKPENGKRKIVKRGMINSISNDGKVFYTLKGLEDGTYFWSVQSVDHGFAGSEFAEEKTFNVGQQPVDQKIVVSSPKWYELHSTTPLNLKVSGIDEQNTVTFSYAGLSQDFSLAKPKEIQLTESGNIDHSFLPEELPKNDPIGIRYRFTIVKKDGKPTEINGVTYWEYDNNRVIYKDTDWHEIGQKKKNEQVLGDYNLISLPFESQPVSALGLGINNTDKWRLFHYNSEIQKFEEYSSNSKLEPRRGYALIMREGETIKFGGKVAEMNGTDADGTPSHHVIKLVKGWNLIGNPFPFAIDLSKALNDKTTGSIGELARLDRNRNDYDYKVESTILNAYEGVFLYNGGGPITIKLYPRISQDSKQIPGGRLSATKPEITNGWELPLIVEHSGFEYSRNGIGMRKEASPGWDIFDGVQLPKLTEYAELLISANTQVPLNRSIVPEQNTYVWNAEIVGAPAGEQVSLHWNSTSVASLEHELFLWDEARGKLVAMNEQGQYSLIVADQATTPLKIYYGPKEELLRTLGLDQPQIGALFPNPTKGIVKLPLLLPETGAPFQLSMKIYNTHGQEISSFSRSGLEAGYQELELNLPESFSGGLLHYNILLEGDAKISTSLNGKILKW